MIQRILLAAVFALTMGFGVGHALADDSDGPVTVKSKDGQTQLTLPAGWAAQDSSNASAAVEGRNEDGNAFVMVVVTDRTDPYLPLDDYARSLRDDVLAHLVKAHVSDPEKIQINGYKAQRFEIHGTSPASKMDFGYYLTVVQMRRHYLEVIGWAVKDHFKENADTLKNAAKNVTFSGDQ